MRYNNFYFIFVIPFLHFGCIAANQSSKGDSNVFNASIANLTQLSTPNGSSLPAITGNNVMALDVNTGACATNSYPNKPCVSVTVCSPTGTNCQTVNDILLDTGSYGLRIFKSAFPSDPSSWLTQVTVGALPVAECARFGDGSAQWGSVRQASVKLTNEPAVTVPIHLIDSTFANYRAASVCPDPETSPAEAGLNGILGVGLLVQDCGSVCAGGIPASPIYYSCNGAGCTGTTLDLASQVQNPVALLPADTGTAGNPQDNNGVIVMLPSVPPAGAVSLHGYVVFGIGTRSNNTPTPGSVTAFTANSNANFFTVYNGTTYSSAFIDSGSNALYFPAPKNGNFPDCSSFYSGIPEGWYCPTNGMNLSATTRGSTGSPSLTVPFQIGSALLLLNSPNYVFSDIGGGQLGNYFDWGLPFFLGRNVYVGFEGRSSSLGSGTYWAY